MLALANLKYTATKYFFFLFFLIFYRQHCIAAEYGRYKYLLDTPIPLTPSISAVIISSNGKLGYDSSLNRIFFRGTILDEHHRILLSCIAQEDIRGKLKDTYSLSEYMKQGGNGNGVELLIAYIFSNPAITEAISLYGIFSGASEKPVVSIANRDSHGKAYAYSKTNEQYIWQPLTLLNASFLAINLTNPWLSLAGNGLALFTFAQNSPLPEFEKQAFPCATFDKALYESSLMSEELWAEFKLAGYYNENDQLNEKFFQDYKDKKLLIHDKFKPYETGIYEGIAAYLKAKNDKTPTEKK